MRSQKSSKIVENTLLFSFILIIFISGFLLLSSIYRFSSTNHKTIVLQDSLFTSSATSKDRHNLKIDNVTKIDTLYPIWNPGIVNDHTLIFETKEQDPFNKIYSLDLTSKSLYTFDDLVESGLLVSPDGKKLIYSKTSKETGIIKGSIYDVQTKEIRFTFDGYALLFAPNGNQFVGVADGTLYLQNILTGEKQDLLESTDLDSTTFAPDNAYKSLKIWNPTYSNDGRYLYFIHLQNKDGPTLYQVDLEKKQSVIKEISGQITKVAPLADGSLLLSGNIKEEEGIFLYHPKTKESKLLISGSIETFDTTPDGTIAYMIKNNNGVSNLHLALLNKDSIESDEMVYSDLNYLSFLKWNNNGDMLFCVSETVNASSVYRFTFHSPS
ncbi:WD40 repeat domain-containing protein [Neobacillus jeddahensis]|uniref:WD40 repeat domain-containing protein n=1 Tax=Neobacillus jeddahensis TaxID=1461580 RepID=UPI00058D3E62|nr:PD40 domain-containing protein [Neobacillus jeddahensis]